MSLRLLIISLVLFFLSACNKSNDKDGSRTSNGGTAIFGTLYIAQDCGVGAASVYVTSPHSGSPIQQSTIGNGGTFNFQLAAGTYTVAAQAGQCQLTPTQVPTVANRSCPYTICLATPGSTCPQAAYTNTSSACGAAYAGGNFNYGANNGFCTYGTYGCANGSYYPGSGYTGYGKPNLYLSATVETEFEIDIDFKEGSNALMSTPSLGMDGWKGKVSPSGEITIGETKYPYLDYYVQAEHKGQQFTSGWCSPRSEVVAKMYNYLTLYGFSEKALADFKAYVTTEKLPPHEKICVYPQESAQITTVLELKTNVDLEMTRIWFTLVPQNETAVLKIKPIPELIASAFKTPTNDAFVALRKNPPNVYVAKADDQLVKKANRQVANRPVIKAQEWGIGFFLEK